MHAGHLGELDLIIAFMVRSSDFRGLCFSVLCGTNTEAQHTD